MSLSHATKGRIVSVNGSTVVFRPSNTTYELHLTHADSPYSGPLDVPVRAVIRGVVRKMYTVPSGGLFVTPIMGETRIIQGRLAETSVGEVALSAVATFNLVLPTTPGAVELAEGELVVGRLVNAVLLPGVTIEVLPSEVPASAT